MKRLFSLAIFILAANSTTVHAASKPINIKPVCWAPDNRLLSVFTAIEATDVEKKGKRQKRQFLFKAYCDLKTLKCNVAVINPKIFDTNRPMESDYIEVPDASVTIGEDKSYYIHAGLITTYKVDIAAGLVTMHYSRPDILGIKGAEGVGSGRCE